MRRTLPPSWLFYTAIINWFSDKDITTQLPKPYRILIYYFKFYIRLYPNTNDLIYGRWLFYLISNLYAIGRKTVIHKIQVGNYSVFIDLLDARFLQVINELRGNNPTKVLGSILSEGDTFIDVGANHGGFSIVASHLVGPSGKIYAFEPQKRLADAVMQSLSLAPAKHEVFQVALGNIDGETDFILPRSYSGTAGLFTGFSGSSEHDVTKVKIHRCDDFLEWDDFSGRLFIKLDIEGGEYNFLSGASKMIKTLKPYILMEINPKAMESAGTKPNDLLSLLKALGYKRFCPETDISSELDLEKIAFDQQYNILLKGMPT